MRLISGLGNQLFQYVVGRYLSIKHEVPLKLDTSFFETQSLRSFALHNYRINAGIASKEEIDKVQFWQTDPAVIAKIYRKTQKILPKSHRYYFKEQEWWKYEPDLLNASSKVYLDGYWQHYKYFEKVPPAIFDELTIKTNTKEGQELKKHIVDSPSSVSIHIRRGDYLTDNLMGALPKDYYLNAVDYMNQKINNPVYYIFSDDLSWARNNLKVDAPMTFVDLTGDLNSDSIELDLMSTCRHNIIANSSFSWWGAFLNRNPEKIVISPTNWVMDPQKNAGIHLQFPSWIKM